MRFKHERDESCNRTQYLSERIRSDAKVDRASMRAGHSESESRVRKLRVSQLL